MENEKPTCVIKYDEQKKELFIGGTCKAGDIKKEKGGLKQVLKDMGLEIVG